MRTTPLALATALILSLTGAALAQTATGTTNDPGSVKSNGDKADPRTVGSSASGATGDKGHSADHNGTAQTLGKGSRPDGSPATPAPRP